MSTDLQRRMAAAEDAPAAPSITELVRRMQPEIARALPAHLSGDRMARIALTEVRRNPGLARASAESLLGALMLAAQLGLEPGPLGLCYLVPRTIKGRPEVVFVVGYRGLAELAYRSGQVTEIHARAVWRGEQFAYTAGDDERIVHTPRLDLDPAPDDLVCAYAVATMTSGAKHRAVISPRDVRRAMAAAGSAVDSGPWRSDFEAMVRKTAVRRLASLLPQSPDLAAGLAVDEAVAPHVQAGAPIPSLDDVDPPRALNGASWADPPVADPPAPRTAPVDQPWVEPAPSPAPAPDPPPPPDPTERPTAAEAAASAPVSAAPPAPDPAPSVVTPNPQAPAPSSYGDPPTPRRRTRRQAPPPPAAEPIAQGSLGDPPPDEPAPEPAPDPPAPAEDPWAGLTEDEVAAMMARDDDYGGAG